MTGRGAGAPPEGLAVRIEGDPGGATVVLVHGGADRAGTFRPLLPHLGGLRVVTYDRRGYGRSLAAAPPVSLVDHARDLLGVVAAQPAPCAVVAHSLGGNVALLAATLDPLAFPALGVWEPALPWVDWWPQATRDYCAAAAAAPDPAAEAESMARGILGEEGWARLDEDVRAARRAEGRAYQVDLASQLSAPYRFTDVTVPTVVGYGTASSEDRRIGGPWLREQLPDARLFVVEGATHWGHRTHPAEFARLVRRVVDLAAERHRGAPSSEETPR
ncbi:alpha/beta fold hydrolase [Trujillonella endophytica]|uniref:Lysophospholipase, alpha-beta hydrolase superfamily n=1 Tax=Trujillonella endophytica TaxID=673521 RepID=A0A1H8RZY7_9ACTN|nr:alpha/beta hydrolase [Trujillella endophytica]SEO71912.1 Lysophospholipase, alpha-beta hydrolase superfamily [Trujillella endophytica]